MIPLNQWLDIADRYGTPLMFALMFFAAIVLVFSWFSRVVAKPLIKSHQEFLASTAQHTAMNSHSLDKLVEANEQQARLLTSHDQRLGRIEIHIERSVCPLSGIVAK